MATNAVKDIHKLLKIYSPEVLLYQLSNTLVENTLLYGESSITGAEGISKMPDSTLHKNPLVRLRIKITIHLK